MPAVLVAVALWFVPPAAAEPRAVDLTITNGGLPSELRVVRVRQGDDVTLRWTADAPVRIHLHGYDLETNVEPGQPAVIRFTATATGRFPIEAHARATSGERTLGYLEVHPR